MREKTIIGSCPVFVTVPSAAPTLVSVQTLNSTSIKVEWLAVPEESMHGIPTRYTIYYAYSDGVVNAKVVTPVKDHNTYQEVVSGLKESTEYSFQVSLSTAEGEGPLTVSKSSATRGGCKWPKIFFHSLFHYYQQQNKVTGLVWKLIEWETVMYLRAGVTFSHDF